MSTNEVLLGVGLTLVLAVGSQVVAGLLRIPALILLLPLGFGAGALTDVVHPDNLVGAAFEPLVSLSVAVILYDAGLGLDLRSLADHPRRIVRRLISLGTLITWGLAAACAWLLLDLSRGAALMLGAILVVSGPTVVGPLLAFVRPVPRVRQILGWEGALIDPVGGILGAVVFTGVVASTHQGPGRQIGEFLVSFLIGGAGAVVGIAVLWLLLRRLRLGEVLGTAAQLAAVVAVAAGCDVIRDDTGLIAAIGMGLAVANLRGFDLPARRPFFETLVQLIIGVLFISISATVTPASLRHLVAPTLALVAILVLLVRPLVAALSTVGTDLARGERAFVGWMAPRGIVAAATASTFSASLAAHGVGGADRILPATFLVIVATVTVYGLTAAPVARRLGIVRESRSRALLVGGDPWVVELARAVRAVGSEVLVWASGARARRRIEAAGLELADDGILAAAVDGGELDGITAVFLLTGEDDFNTLAASLLSGSVDGPVYRLAPAESAAESAAEHPVAPPGSPVSPAVDGAGGGDGPAEVLFGPGFVPSTVEDRPILTLPATAAVPAGADLLFVVSGDGRLEPVTSTHRPEPAPDGRLILLGAGRPAGVPSGESPT